MSHIILSVPLVFLFFLIIISLGYIVLSSLSNKGLDHEEKYLPYTGGQHLPPSESKQSYRTFFRLGLLFGIVHIAALILATLPFSWNKHQIGLLYLIGIAISAFVLVKI